MPFFLRILSDGSAAVCETTSPKLEVPSHIGSIWMDGDLVCLQFPSIDDIKIEGYPRLQIVSHVLRFPADENGITSVEAVIYMRKEMMQKGNEALLLAFAERGTDRPALLRLYKEILS